MKVMSKNISHCDPHAPPLYHVVLLGHHSTRLLDTTTDVYYHGKFTTIKCARDACTHENHVPGCEYSMAIEVTMTTIEFSPKGATQDAFTIYEKTIPLQNSHAKIVPIETGDSRPRVAFAVACIAPSRPERRCKKAGLEKSFSFFCSIFHILINDDDCETLTMSRVFALGLSDKARFHAAFAIHANREWLIVETLKSVVFMRIDLSKKPVLMEQFMYDGREGRIERVFYNEQHGYTWLLCRNFSRTSSATMIWVPHLFQNEFRIHNLGNLGPPTDDDDVIYHVCVSQTDKHIEIRQYFNDAKLEMVSKMLVYMMRSDMRLYTPESNRMFLPVECDSQHEMGFDALSSSIEVIHEDQIAEITNRIEQNAYEDYGLLHLTQWLNRVGVKKTDLEMVLEVASRDIGTGIAFLYKSEGGKKHSFVFTHNNERFFIYDTKTISRSKYSFRNPSCCNLFYFASVSLTQTCTHNSPLCRSLDYNKAVTYFDIVTV